MKEPVFTSLKRTMACFGITGYINRCNNAIHITAKKEKWLGSEGSGPIFYDAEVNVLEAYEARRGELVRVREENWKNEFAGMLGTIQTCWGQSEHSAVDVLLEDRRSEFFWLTDLQAV